MLKSRQGHKEAQLAPTLLSSLAGLTRSYGSQPRAKALGYFRRLHAAKWRPTSANVSADFLSNRHAILWITPTVNWWAIPRLHFARSQPTRASVSADFLSDGAQAPILFKVFIDLPVPGGLVALTGMNGVTKIAQRFSAGESGQKC
jgi:hypothetical protein